MSTKNFFMTKGNRLYSLNVSEGLLGPNPGYGIVLKMSPEEFESLVSAVNNPKIIHGGAKEEAKT